MIIVQAEAKERHGENCRCTEAAALLSVCIYFSLGVDNKASRPPTSTINAISCHNCRLLSFHRS